MASFDSNDTQQPEKFDRAVIWARDLPDLLDGQGRYDRKLHQFAMVVATFADWDTGKNCRPGSGTLERILRVNDKSVRELWKRGVEQGLWVDTGRKHRATGVTIYDLRLDADLSAKDFLIDDKRAARRKADRDRQARRREALKASQGNDRDVTQRATVTPSRNSEADEVSRQFGADVTVVSPVTSRQSAADVTHQTAGDQSFNQPRVDQPVDKPIAPASRTRGISEAPTEKEQNVQEPVADHTEEEPGLDLKNFTTSLDEQPDASFVVQSAEELNAALDKIFANEKPQKTSDHPAATEPLDEIIQAALDVLGPAAPVYYEPSQPIERRPVPVLTPEEIERQVAARRKQPTEAQKKHQEFLDQQMKFEAEYEAANPLPKRSEGVDIVQRAREALTKAPRRRGGRRKKQPVAPENLQSYEGIKCEFGPYLGEPHKLHELDGTPYDPARLFKAYEEALAERGLAMDWQYSGELRRFISAFLFHTGGDEFRVAKALQSVLDNESVTHPHNSKVAITFAGHALVSGLSFIGSKALGIHLRRSA